MVLSGFEHFNNYVRVSIQFFQRSVLCWLRRSSAGDDLYRRRCVGSSSATAAAGSATAPAAAAASWFDGMPLSCSRSILLGFLARHWVPG
jgi:hypothetical protein